MLAHDSKSAFDNLRRLSNSSATKMTTELSAGRAT
jgi:hypothetical protein